MTAYCDNYTDGWSCLLSGDKTATCDPCRSRLASIGSEGVRANVRRTASRVRRDGEGRVATHQGADMHSPEGHDVISAELVACTLGHRSRPELQVVTLGQIARAIRRAGQQMAHSLTVALAPFSKALEAAAQAERERQRELHERAARRN